MNRSQVSLSVKMGPQIWQRHPSICLFLSLGGLTVVRKSTRFHILGLFCRGTPLRLYFWHLYLFGTRRITVGVWLGNIITFQSYNISRMDISSNNWSCIYVYVIKSHIYRSGSIMLYASLSLNLSVAVSLSLALEKGLSCSRVTYKNCTSVFKNFSVLVGPLLNLSCVPQTVRIRKNGIEIQTIALTTYGFFPTPSGQ